MSDTSRTPVNLSPRVRCVGGPLDGYVLWDIGHWRTDQSFIKNGARYERVEYRGGAIWEHRPLKVN